MQTIQLGVIGFGRIGKVHAENLIYRIPEAEVTAVSTPNPSAEQTVKQLGVPNFYTNNDDLIQNSAIEAIVICSPTPSHFPLIEKAAKAGKHIFCEKPLDMTISKIEEMIDIVNRYGVKLQVGFNQRFDPNFKKVKSQVVNGKIGDPHILKITSRDPGPPPVEYIRSSGGLFMDMTIHDFDMARFIVDSEVVEVFAKGAVRVDEAIGAEGDIDTAAVTLYFENGCIGLIDNSRKAAYGYDQRLEIFGSEGMSKVANNYYDTETLYNSDGRQTGRPLDFFMERYTESYCEEIRAFVKAINENHPIPVTAQDAMAATKIALAANESMRLNQPVRIK